MSISTLGQNFSATLPSSGTKILLQAKIENDASPNSSHPTKIDMRNISIDEINTLIKSGESAFLDVAPFINPSTLQQYDTNPEKIGKIRVDLISQIEASIELKKSLGEGTDFLDNILKKFKDLDGTQLNKKINLFA